MARVGNGQLRSDEVADGLVECGFERPCRLVVMSTCSNVDEDAGDADGICPWVECASNRPPVFPPRKGFPFSGRTNCRLTTEWSGPVDATTTDRRPQGATGLNSKRCPKVTHCVVSAARIVALSAQSGSALEPPRCQFPANSSWHVRAVDRGKDTRASAEVEQVQKRRAPGGVGDGATRSTDSEPAR